MPQNHVPTDLNTSPIMTSPDARPTTQFPAVDYRYANGGVEVDSRIRQRSG